MGFRHVGVPIVLSNQFQGLPEQLSDFDDPDFFRQSCQNNRLLFELMALGDIIVINGEGSLHHLTPTARALLYLAYAAKRYLNKPVHIINHSVYPDNTRKPTHNVAFELYTKVYQQLDFIAIREHISQRLMQSMGIDTQLSFDCLPLALTNFEHSYTQGKKLVIAG